MPIRVPPNLPPEDSRNSWEPSAVLRLKRIVARLRRYLLGHSQIRISAREVETLELCDWAKALFGQERSTQRRERAIHKLFYASSSNIETTVPDVSPNPFEVFYEKELISRIEKDLIPEEWPYWEALLAGERPRHVAARLGIDRKLASKKMKKLEAKVISILFGQSRSA